MTHVTHSNLSSGRKPVGQSSIVIGLILTSFRFYEILQFLKDLGVHAASLVKKFSQLFVLFWRPVFELNLPHFLLDHQLVNALKLGSDELDLELGV